MHCTIYICCRGDDVQYVSEKLLLEDQQQFREHPVDTANWFSFATFYWMGNLMALANKQGLTDTDLPNIPKKESCKQCADELEKLWAREISFADERSKSRPSFSKVAWLFVRSRVLITLVVYMISLFLGFLTPVRN